MCLGFGFFHSIADYVRFCTVSYCGNTRRVSVGGKNGSLAVYDLKQSKCQVDYISLYTRALRCNFTLAEEYQILSK